MTKQRCEGPGRPNVVLMVMHDLGDYLGCYGRQVQSPNLDRFAQEGARFTKHFCASPFCSPSRGSIITGQYPHTHGLMGLCNLGWDLPGRAMTDAKRFESAGYRTCLVGFQHEKRKHADLGFQIDLGNRFLASSNYATDYVAECAGEVLGAFAEKQRRGEHTPFYMRIGSYSVHRTLDPVSGSYGYEPMHGRGLAESEVDILPQWMDTPGLRFDLAGFTGEVRNMDRGIGLVLDAIRDSGLEDNTLVIFTTDHGIDFPRAKGTLYDLGTQTALMMRYPGRISAGTTVSGLSSHVDILPTLLEFCGIPATPEIQGRSLLSLINGPYSSVRDHVFAEESTFPGNLMRAIRTDRFKLIRNFIRGPRSNALTNSRTRTVMDTGRFYFVNRPEYELYDLITDPNELVNVSEKSEYREIEIPLREQLRQWLIETNDPVLTNAIERPVDEYDLFPGDRDARNEHAKCLWEIS